jgi:hypothetical protein
VAQTRFFRKLPIENATVALSQFAVVRSMAREHKQEILAVNYVNGRFMRLPSAERRILNLLAENPMSLPSSTKALRGKLEKLNRFGLLTVLEVQDTIQ